MPIQASFGRTSRYRACGVNGDPLVSRDLDGSDTEGIGWARQPVMDGLFVEHLTRRDNRWLWRRAVRSVLDG
jgi:hypothetical protein